MINSNDSDTLEDESDLPEVDYSTLPDNIREAIEIEQFTIEKDAKLSWDGRQFIVRIPSEIANEMGISKDNKKEFKVHFKYVKPAPNTDIKPNVKMDLTWTQPNKE